MRLELLRRAQLKVAVDDDGIQLLPSPLGLLGLDVELVLRLAPGHAVAHDLADRLRLPAPAAVRLADRGGDDERVRLELGVGDVWGVAREGGGEAGAQGR